MTHNRRKTFSDLRAYLLISEILDQSSGKVVFFSSLCFDPPAVPSANLIRTLGGEWSLKRGRVEIRKKMHTFSKPSSLSKEVLGHFNRI